MNIMDNWFLMLAVGGMSLFIVVLGYVSLDEYLRNK